MFVLKTYPKMYVFKLFIYLQSIVFNKDQFNFDFKDFNWRYSQCASKSKCI